MIHLVVSIFYNKYMFMCHFVQNSTTKCYRFSASVCAVFIQTIVNGAIGRSNDVNIPKFNPKLPNFTVLLTVYPYFLGGWTAQCPSGNNQMQGGFWTHARHCGNCGHDSQPDGSCNSIFIYACVTCAETDLRMRCRLMIQCKQVFLCQ